MSMASKARFLRIALVHDDQVLEERHVALGTDVTIGTAPDNTLVAPRGTAPRSVRVLEARRGEGHTLLFDAPEGRVDLGAGEASTLAELVEGGLAARTDRGFALPLPPKARGRLRVGDVTLLFQYLERDTARAARPAAAPASQPAAARSGQPAVARPPQHSGARPMTLEATLTWDGTVLATRSFHPLRSVTVGPLPECDLQLPGKVLEHRAFPIVGGDGGRFFVDLRNPHLVVDELVAAARAEDGSRVMRAQRVEGDRYPITGPFRMRLTLRDGFALELRHAPALARTAGSPFDVQDPQPLLCLAGSALAHAIIMVIAFAVGQSLLSADEVKAAKVERRRELYTMLQEQKIEAQVEQERAAEEQAEPDEAADKDAADKPEEPREAAKKAEATPERPKRDASRERAADAGAATPEARRTKLREGVRQKTFLGVLGGEGQQGDGALPVGRETRYADAFDDVAAPYAANGGGSDALAPPGPDAGGSGDGPAYKTLSKEESGGESIATRTVETADKGAAEEAKVKVDVRTGSLGEEGGLGSINHQAVAGVFARRKGAIKACYEKELRRNPDLKGRITLRFTIGTSGRITSISVSQNTTGDDAIASCIIERVQSWKFDPPSGGAVTFTYPFILEAR